MNSDTIQRKNIFHRTKKCHQYNEQWHNLN
jgi:hypothetical protein